MTAKACDPASLRPALRPVLWTIVLLGLVLSPLPAAAQGLETLFLEPDAISSRAVQLFALVTILSLAPAIAIMVTCFPFIVTVLSILRQAIGLQQAPPNMLIISLALFLTYFVMDPVLQAAWQNGAQPLVAGEMSVEDAFRETLAPFRGFMANRVDPGAVLSPVGNRPGL